jgi:hypothetical protein
LEKPTPKANPSPGKVQSLAKPNQTENMTTQKQIRAAFWGAHPEHEAHALKWGIKTAPHNRHNADTRMAWVDFVDQLAKAGEISENLAFRATL